MRSQRPVKTEMNTMIVKRCTQRQARAAPYVEKRLNATSWHLNVGVA